MNKEPNCSLVVFHINTVPPPPPLVKTKGLWKSFMRKKEKVGFFLKGLRKVGLFFLRGALCRLFKLFSLGRFYLPRQRCGGRYKMKNLARPSSRSCKTNIQKQEFSMTYHHSDNVFMRYSVGFPISIIFEESKPETVTLKALQVSHFISYFKLIHRSSSYDSLYLCVRCPDSSNKLS